MDPGDLPDPEDLPDLFHQLVPGDPLVRWVLGDLWDLRDPWGRRDRQDLGDRWGRDSPVPPWDPGGLWDRASPEGPEDPEAREVRAYSSSPHGRAPAPPRTGCCRDNVGNLRRFDS